ncbi:MAG: hypothetical protein WAT71_17210 [Ignavibacteria bacterium]
MKSTYTISILIFVILIFGFIKEDNSGHSLSDRDNKNLISLNICQYFWTTQNSGTSNLLNSVSTFSDSIGWAGGEGPTVIRTTNGGTNWTNVTGSGISGSVKNIFAKSSTEAFCTTSPDTTFIFRTTNGGLNWSIVYSQEDGLLNAIQMVSSTDGYALGNPVGGKWTIVKTTNGGANWARMATEPTEVGFESGWKNSFQVSGSNMWFGTNSTKVYRSTNSGVTWTSAATTGSAISSAVHFNNSNDGLTGGTAMLKSTNGGVSYSTVTTPGISGGITGIEGNGTDWWALRSDSSVYRSTNHGTNWSTVFSQTGTVYQDIDFVTASNGCQTGWTVGNGGVLAKMSSSLSADYEISNIYALGKVPIKYGYPDTVCFRISKKISYTDTVKVCLRVINLDNTVKFEQLITIPSMLAADTIVCVALPEITEPKTDLIIVNAMIENSPLQDQCSPDNERSKIYRQKVTYDTYNQAQDSVPAIGGFGFNGRTGNYLSGFRNRSTDTFKIKSIDQSFFDSIGGGNKPYKVIIYNDNGSGKPGSQLYISSTLNTPTGTGSVQSVTHNLSSSVNIPGNSKFYVGYKQTSVSNIKISYQNESPVRKKTFFFTASDSGSTWYDFADSSKNFLLDISPRSGSRLDLTAFIEGFYNSGSNTMIKDTVRVYLRNVSSPYPTVDSAKGILNNSGTGSFIFNNAINGVNYYLKITHRNAIETWSTSGNSFTNNLLTYNFSNAASSAFGSNMISIDNSPVRFGFYSGDVSRDGVVDLTDGGLIDNDAFNFVSGYINTDVNGDDIVDLGDAVFTDNNAFNFIAAVTP